jgi:hypothetical protein
MREFATDEQVARCDLLADPDIERHLRHLRRGVAALGFVGIQALQLSVLVSHELYQAAERRLASARSKLKLKELFGTYVRAE